MMGQPRLRRPVRKRDKASSEEHKRGVLGDASPSGWSRAASHPKPTRTAANENPQDQKNKRNKRKQTNPPEVEK